MMAECPDGTCGLVCGSRTKTEPDGSKTTICVCYGECPEKEENNLEPINSWGIKKPHELNFLNMQSKTIYITLVFLLFGFTNNTNILEEDLVITDEVFLSNSLRLEVKANSKSKIFVANMDLNSIYVFSKDGKKEKQISREGRGPGEFTGLGDIFMDANDNLYALDRKNGKVTVFSPPNYNVMNEYSIPIRLNNQRPENLLIAKDGNLLIAYSEILSISNSKNKDNKLYSIDLNQNKVKDTILEYSDNQIFVYTKGNKISTMEVPYGYKSILKIGPKGKLFWGKTDREKIQIFNGEGNQISSIKMDYNAVEIPSESLQYYKDLASASDPFAEIVKKLLESDLIPEIYPIFNWFILDDENRVWIAVNTKDREKYALKIYDQQGNKIVQTKLSKTVELKEVRNGYAYGIKNGEKGMQSVVRYKLNGLNGE